MIKINYPGSGNNSEFILDGSGQLVKIVETVSGSVSSTKQFVLGRGEMLEVRDASGALLGQYPSHGQLTISGGVATSYFYDQNHRVDVVGVSNSSGAEVASCSYDPYGNRQLVGSFVPDFSFAGMYTHARSGLSLGLLRAYNPKFGRWLNRDPIDESGGVNLYDYALNDPVGLIDPAGAAPLPFYQIQKIVSGNNSSGLPDEYIICQIWQESSFDQDAKTWNPSGHQWQYGLGQVGQSAWTDWYTRLDPSLVVVPPNMFPPIIPWESVINDPNSNVLVGTGYLANRIQDRGGLAAGLGGYGTGGSAMNNKIDQCAECLKKQLHMYGPPNPQCCLNKLHK